MRPTTLRASYRSAGLRAVSGPVVPLVVALALTGLTGCSNDSSKAAAPTSQTPSSSPSGSPSTSPSATSTPTPSKPTAPRFAPGDKGQKAFAEYVVRSWGYALSTNDATAVTGLSPSKKEQCRGCKDLSTELKRRAKDGWLVDYPGARVRRTTLERTEDRILATTVADLPASRSFFDDGTFRNDNEAHKGAKFLIDLRIDGKAKKRHYVLLAFSLR